MPDLVPGTYMRYEFMCKKPVKSGKNTQVLCGQPSGTCTGRAERKRERERTREALCSIKVLKSYLVPGRNTQVPSTKVSSRPTIGEGFAPAERERGPDSDTEASSSCPQSD